MAQAHAPPCMSRTLRHNKGNAHDSPKTASPDCENTFTFVAGA